MLTVLDSTPVARYWFHCDSDAPTPTSSSSLLVIGELYVSCMKLFGSNRYPLPNSFRTADDVPPQLQAVWWSKRKLNLFFGFGWNVTRPRYESYHSQRPLYA